MNTSSLAALRYFSCLLTLPFRFIRKCHVCLNCVGITGQGKHLEINLLSVQIHFSFYLVPFKYYFSKRNTMQVETVCFSLSHIPILYQTDTSRYITKTNFTCLLGHQTSTFTCPRSTFTCLRQLTWVFPAVHKTVRR